MLSSHFVHYSRQSQGSAKRANLDYSPEAHSLLSNFVFMDERCLEITLRHLLAYNIWKKY